MGARARASRLAQASARRTRTAAKMTAGLKTIILLSFVLAVSFLLVILSCALWANWLQLPRDRLVLRGLHVGAGRLWALCHVHLCRLWRRFACCSRPCRCDRSHCGVDECDWGRDRLRHHAHVQLLLQIAGSRILKGRVVVL